MPEDRSTWQLFELIAGIHVRVRRLLQEQLSAAGLTYPQYGALSVLEGRSGLSQQDLAEALRTDTTNIMVICDGLETKGMIARERNPRDRRRYVLSLTRGGEQALAPAHEIVAGLLSRLPIDVSAQDFRTTLDYLGRLLDDVTRIGRSP